MKQLLQNLKTGATEIVEVPAPAIPIFSHCNSESELAILKKLAKDLLGLTVEQLSVAVGEGSLVEVEHET